MDKTVLESKIKARGREFFASIIGETPSIFNKDWWTGKVMDWSMQNENFKHAARIYKKVYNSDFSHDSRAVAALGAGRAFNADNDLQNTIIWLTRYIEVTRNKPTDQLYLAYHLLGKTYLKLGKNELASDALTKNPDRTYGDIMKDVAPEVRKRLDLPACKPSVWFRGTGAFSKNSAGILRGPRCSRT